MEVGPGVVVDAHQHVGVPGEPIFSEEWIQSDLAARRGQMVAMGLDRCVVLPTPSSAGGFRNVDHGAMNDSMARYRAAAPDLIIAAGATTNPAEPRAAVKELERAFGDLDMRCAVFHHRYLGMMINDPRMPDLLQVADEYERTVFVHIISDSTFEAAWRLFSLARRFPNARFLALDGFSSAAQSMMLREWAPDHPNVWFDTGAMTSVAHQLGEFIERCGPQRLVLGTDLYSGHPHFLNAFPLLELRAQGLDDSVLDLICRQNVLDLLGYDLSLPPGEHR